LNENGKEFRRTDTHLGEAILQVVIASLSFLQMRGIASLVIVEMGSVTIQDRGNRQIPAPHHYDDDLSTHCVNVQSFRLL
jgi:hypothetical protein